MRIEREQEIERQRKEKEMDAMKQKQEREKKRKEALQEALETAEKAAKVEKLKQKTIKQNTLDSLEDGDLKKNTNVIHNQLEKNSESKKNNNVEQDKNKNLIISPREECFNNNNNSNIEEKSNVSSGPRINNTLDNNFNNMAPSTSEVPNLDQRTSYQILTPRPEMALVLPTPMDGLQTLQYAVLMPNLPSTSIPIAIPLSLTNPQPPLNTPSPRTENRILTPTQYRRSKKLCDSSTQTDPPDSTRSESESNNLKYVRETMTNLELNYDNKSGRKDRRNRSDEKSVGDRPKWGANRPPTRYMKQSEKDLLYQRRKQRQKEDYKNNSSDESRTGTPRSYRKKNYGEKRHHRRALWRKKDHFFTRNIRMYQTEIIPLESDKEQIYYSRSKCDCCCRCGCSASENKTDILKIESNSPKLPDCGISGENAESPRFVVDKLNSLHSGLLIKQEPWERSPRTPSLSSCTARNPEI